MSGAVDRVALARVLGKHTPVYDYKDGRFLMACEACDFTLGGVDRPEATRRFGEHFADVILSSGVLLDAAEVRAQALEHAADACQAKAKEAHEAGPEYNTLGHALRAQARWLRDCAASEREGKRDD